MAHDEHNRPRRRGAFVLIILGAIIFITAPTYLRDNPELGMTAIVFGFIVGGLGFYLNYMRKKT